VEVHVPIPTPTANDQLWRPAPGPVSNDDPDDSTAGGDIDAALAAIDFETADLPALHDDGTDVEETSTAPVEPRTTGQLQAGHDASDKERHDARRGFDEPQLESGGASGHVNPRFGLTRVRPGRPRHSGRPDSDQDRRGRPADQLDGLRQESCSWTSASIRFHSAVDVEFPQLRTP
jgi:hypothetical protein